MQSFFKLIQEQNLGIDHEDLKLIKEYLSDDKRIGLIGFKGLENLEEDLSLLTYHPDLFDISAQYSNFSNLKKELEENFDLIIILSNKLDLYPLNIPIIKIRPNNLVLEIIGEDLNLDINSWIESLNLDLRNLKTILNKGEIKREFTGLEEIRVLYSIDIFNDLEKEEYLLESAHLGNNYYSFFEIPLNLDEKQNYPLAYTELFKSDDLTQNQLNSLRNFHYIFIDKELKKENCFKNLTDSEVLYFSEDQLPTVLRRIKKLLVSSPVLLVINYNRSSFVYEIISKQFKEIEIIPFLGINDQIKAIFGLKVFKNYLNLDLQQEIEFLALSPFREVCSLIFRNVNFNEKKCLEILNLILDKDQKIGLYNTHSGEGRVTTSEFLNEFTDSDILIIPQKNLTFNGEFFN